MLLPGLLWLLTICKIGLSAVDDLERKVNRYTKTKTKMAMPSSSPAITCRLHWGHKSATDTKVHCGRVQALQIKWMLTNSVDSRIHKDKLLLRSGRKFWEQNETDKSVAVLMFKEVRGPIRTGCHAVGWNHLQKLSQASSSLRPTVISQERRWNMYQDWVTRAMQQAQ